MRDRRARFAIAGQLRLLTPLALAWTLAVGGLTAIGVQDAVPAEHLFLDPAALAGAPWYSGVVSNLGILAWTVAATASAGGAWVAGRTGRPSAMWFLAVGSAVTTLLLLDDLLQLHSTLLPRLLGLPKPAALALVVGPAVVWCVQWRHEIARTRWVILLAAALGSLASVAIDLVLQPTGSTALLAEDGSKFLGVVAWSVFFVTTAVDITRSTIAAALDSRSTPSPQRVTADS